MTYRWFFQQLIVGVDYLHRMEIASRDIKLENTLLDTSPRPLVKICDFGYSKVGCINIIALTLKDSSSLRSMLFQGRDDAQLSCLWLDRLLIFRATKAILID